MNTVRLKQNVGEIQGRITDAARRSGREASAVTLVAVTKYVDAPAIRELVGTGCQVLGESRPQALWQKATELSDLAPTWHLVGHLQRNKVEKTLPLTRLIHSVDSTRLISAIDSAAERAGTTCDVLFEVNVSGDATKHGWSPANLPAVMDELSQYPHVNVRGLMTMAALQADVDQSRRNFADLRRLFDTLNRSSPVPLTELSMGMSRDYEIAIEEGATLVRVGSALWEGCK